MHMTWCNYHTSVRSTGSRGLLWYLLAGTLLLKLTPRDFEPARPIALRLSAMAIWVQHTLSIL